MFVIRKDGHKMTIGEQKNMIILFGRQLHPVPYTDKDLMTFNPDGTLTLEVHYVDEFKDVECYFTFFDTTDERLKLGNYVSGDGKNKRWDILRQFCDVKVETIQSKINNMIGGYWDFLDSVTWYNGLAEHVMKWRQEAFAKIETAIETPIKTAIETAGYTFQVDTTSYGVEEHDVREIYQLQVLWMIAVDKFGSYGTSPRTGWIDNEKLSMFVLWCDEITQTYSRHYASISYIDKQEEMKND